jgi:hypothetical protein
VAAGDPLYVSVWIRKHTMSRVKSLTLFALLGSAALAGLAYQPPQAGAHQTYVQYYSSWRYHPTRTYYYSSYYYKPTVEYVGYKHHYCIHYPQQYPNYVYYYNPYKQTYWGRYDFENKGYSLLDPKDRKQKLEEIPESAFPPPGEMPPIPESQGEVVRMERPPALPRR